MQICIGLTRVCWKVGAGRINCFNEMTVAQGKSLMNQMMHFAHRHDGGAYLIESPVPALPPAEVRCLSINDRDRLDRDAFVTALFPQVDIRTFADEDTHIISRAEWDYDVVIISGNDVKRMGRYLRINSPLLGVAARIALISDSTPPHQAIC